MILKAVALVLSAALSVEAAITTHEALKGTESAALVSFGDRIMPLDEHIDMRKARTHPDAADAHLKNAIRKNPYNTANWIQLSVDAEAEGNLTEAKVDLDEAAAHDAGAAPHWATANYYFRRGDQKSLLESVNAYRKVTHEAEPGLFRMVAEGAPDVPSIMASMPNLGCDELGSLLDTVRERNLDSDAVVDRMNASCHDEASGKLVAHYMSDLLRADKPDLAQHVRERIGENDPIINSMFKSPVTGEGFDWRINNSSDIQVKQEADQGIAFNFEDRVPSGTVLLFQPISLDPASRYRLSMKLVSNPREDESFRWELVELSTGRHINSGLDEEHLNTVSAWEFQVPRSDKTLAIAFFYKRTEGELPYQGTVNLQGVGLARALPLASISARTRK